MQLTIYNTLHGKEEAFKPLNEGTVGFYSCGPTVYEYAHMGNLRTYIFNDILKRVLRYDGFKVKHVMNITDVGHLTSDADTGEDKVEMSAIREGRSVCEIAQHYTNAFKEDIRKLNITEPDIWCKATDHIDDMIKMIKTLETKGYTYTSNGNVYFDTSKFEHYAEFAGLRTSSLVAGARTGLDKNKRCPLDFVLWFTLESSKFGKAHAMKWDSPWGVGYPGWHIECSAMSSKYLGEQFDIHTGGIDHIPVHHTNEIAQAEAAFGKHPWVQYWLHGNFLIVERGKMAKSAGNFIRMASIEEHGYEPLAYRFFCLNAHYRSELNFTWEALDSAQKGYDRLKKKIVELKSEATKSAPDKAFRDLSGIASYNDKFEDAINDDLNMPVAIATLLELVNDSTIESRPKLHRLLRMDEVLGLGIRNMEKRNLLVPEEVQKLLEERENARKRKDWQMADTIRKKIMEYGFSVVDTPDGQKLDRK